MGVLARCQVEGDTGRAWGAPREARDTTANYLAAIRRVIDLENKWSLVFDGCPRAENYMP